MPTLRPIDAASTPDEVLAHVLTMPIEDADAIRSLLWDFKAGIISELRGHTRIEVLEQRKPAEFLAGPYGLLGPYGVVGLLVALTIAYFTLNLGLFVLGFLATYGFCLIGMIRTTPRWTKERVTEHAARPANAALVLTWAKTQGLALECTEEITQGLRDTTDYYNDLVIVALEQDPKLATKVANKLLAKNPENFPWVWRFAPSKNLFHRIETAVLDDTHTVGVVALASTLEEIPEASDNPIVDAALKMIHAPTEAEVDDATPLPVEVLLEHARPAQEADLDRVAVTNHPLVLHILDQWRRSPDVNQTWQADRLLRAAIHQQTGLHVPRAASIETILDSVLFPMLDDPEFGPMVRAGFFERRERDMNTQRRVDPDGFESFFCHEVHTHILWGVYTGKNLRGTFRIDETFKLVDVADKPFAWEPNNVVGVVHPHELSAETREAWQLVFADYDLHGFDQLSRPFYEAPNENIVYFDGVPDLTILGQHGWSGRDDGEDFRLERVFDWNGPSEKGVVEVTPEGTSLAFWTMEGPMSVRLKRPLSELHAIPVSEAIYAVKLSLA